jgi:acetylornithine aminotransferase/acetylornithine/N-succinyldiaminopimelate aminotransferase
MLALDLNSADLAKAVAKQLLQEGIIINRTHETVLRFLPPYIIQEKHVDQLISALDSALLNVARARKPVPPSKSKRSQA